MERKENDGQQHDQNGSTPPEGAEKSTKGEVVEEFDANLCSETPDNLPTTKNVAYVRQHDEETGKVLRVVIIISN
jgi:hypothetical protein